MIETSDLTAALVRHRSSFAPVIPHPLDRRVAVLDLSRGSAWLAGVDPSDTVGFPAAVAREMVRQRADVGIGQYGEDRIIYRHSSLFDGTGQPRTVHLGIDLFVAAETPVSVPLAGRVHSFADNSEIGDYGPTVIVEHAIDELRFYTLFGHLSRSSLSAISRGQELSTGERLAQLGGVSENGGWPPHLHFQIIADLGDAFGDFPGVATVSDRHRFMTLCPDPNLVLGIPALEAASNG